MKSKITVYGSVCSAVLCILSGCGDSNTSTLAQGNASYYSTRCETTTKYKSKVDGTTYESHLISFEISTSYASSTPGFESYDSEWAELNSLGERISPIEYETGSTQVKDLNDTDRQTDSTFTFDEIDAAGIASKRTHTSTSVWRKLPDGSKEQILYSYDGVIKENRIIKSTLRIGENKYQITRNYLTLSRYSSEEREATSRTAVCIDEELSVKPSMPALSASTSGYPIPSAMPAPMPTPQPAAL